jgi:6,7-dimethyl-8-ribityllumazine synthase
MSRYDNIFEIEPSLAGAGLRVAVVMSRFNQDVGEGLLGACTAELKRLGVKDGNLLIATVQSPGAAARPAASGPERTLRHVVALGCVVRGGTALRIVSSESARGITGAQLQPACRSPTAYEPRRTMLRPWRACSRKAPTPPRRRWRWPF